MPPPSGAGMTCASVNPIIEEPCDAGYLGSFKHNMQLLVNAAAAAGKQLILAKAPPHLTNASRDTLIRGYNGAIGELVIENGFSYTPPDFHAYFADPLSGPNPASVYDLMWNDLHPNGEGYHDMANLWCQSLNGLSLNGQAIACTP